MEFHSLHTIIDDNINENNKERPTLDSKEKEECDNEQLNVILRKDTIKKYLANWHHQTLFILVKCTLIDGIKEQYFATWPGLSTKLISKHLPPSVKTALGHLNQERQHVQSTTRPSRKKKTVIVMDPIPEENLLPVRDFLVKQPLLDTFKPDEIKSSDINLDTHPSSDSPNTKTNNIIYTITSTKDDNFYMDLTGCFPFWSASGNEYIMVAYNYDANAILVQPVKIEKHVC